LVGFVFVVAKLMGLLPDIPGWTSVLVLILFTGGVQMLSVGILGQYIGRIYDEAKRRPPYIVKHSLGLDIPDLVKSDVNLTNNTRGL
jgi:dolichol-phosphate mannosyltransferase